MKHPLISERVLLGLFLTLVFCVPIWQAVVEIRRGERPQGLDVFRQKPTAANLRAYEHELEDASELGKRVRPWAQYAQFAWLRDGGEKVLIGKDGWLFYGPGVQYVTEREDARKGNSTVPQALEAIIAFRNDLASKGVKLLVMPVPNKESVYPEQLSRRARTRGGVVSEDMSALLAGLQSANVEVLDLWKIFADAKSSGGMPLYLAQDSHWSPAGLKMAASAVAERIRSAGWVSNGQVEYEYKPRTELKTGDLLRMLRVPALERRVTPERLECEQVTRCDDHSVYRDEATSDVLILGDSFLRIYQTDGPGAAGFIAHLAKELKRPLATIVNDGGASTLVRQELSRRPALLTNKKLVIWEFVERDIRLGTEGWQVIRN